MASLSPGLPTDRGQEEKDAFWGQGVGWRRVGRGEQLPM